jgi:electron transport complex protein RnfG
MSSLPSAATPPAAAQPHSGRLIATLAAIAMMSGLLVALTAQLTHDRIIHNRQQALERAVFTVLTDATSRRNFLLDESGLTPLPEAAFAQANVFAGYDAGGRLVGVAMEASARGYQDVVTILYGYSLERECVVGITVLQSTETPGLGDKVDTDPQFLANFHCLDARLNPERSAPANPIVTVKNGRKTDPWQIDGISGATVTSTAIGNALRASTTRMLPLLAPHADALQNPGGEP